MMPLPNALTRRALGAALASGAVLAARPARADATLDRILAAKKITVAFVNNRP
ncbi:hypothetical protein [Rhodovarius lipocyclicus]|uniref:hypothetical protein n=1 Tax=Rhodovarius lipocyclicus TaxID=268410 RepID=UPI00135BA432|nr:hypothetical protein [Rhodovarius lipocyclicus]